WSGRSKTTGRPRSAPLGLELVDERPIGRRLDDSVELCAVVRHETHALDPDIIRHPSVAPAKHPVIHRNLGPLRRDDASADRRLIAVDGVLEDRIFSPK